jgi:hypothetical protein
MKSALNGCLKPEIILSIHNMKNFTLTLAFLWIISQLNANSAVNLSLSFDWDEEPIEFYMGNTPLERWTFDGAVHSDEFPGVPFSIRSFPVQGAGRLEVDIINASYEAFPRTPRLFEPALSETLDIKTMVIPSRKGAYGKITFSPIILRAGRYERLTRLDLRIRFISEPSVIKRGPLNTEESILSNGDIYKIAVSSTGVHKLSYAFLKDQLGIDLDNIDPARIQLFGNGGGVLPENIQIERIDDLEENAIWIQGAADGSFDASDYLLFFAEGPDRWTYDSNSGDFNMTKNIYDDRNYYFIKIGSQTGRRISEQASISSTAYTTNTFQDYDRFEEDRFNLMHEWIRAQGSGKTWYGSHFKVTREYTFNNLFEFPGLDLSEAVRVKARMALRATRRSSFSLDINGQSLSSDLASRVTILSGSRDNEISYAHPAVIDAAVNVNENQLNVIARYPYPGGNGDGSEGWLDYIQVNVRRNLSMSGDQLLFRDPRTLDYPGTTFQLGNANDQLQLWDITNPLQPKLQQYELSGNLISFGVNTNSLKEFVAFSPSANLFTPEAIGKVANQNIHGIAEANMVILYPQEFEAAAQRLARHRENHSGLQVELVLIDQLYNEFSSGRLDPTAIRDFVKMLYDRTANFEYLLLLGDGSFDFRDRYELGGNFIPVYETESFNPIYAYPTDDYFGLLEPSTQTRPGDPLSGDMSISIGRLPAQSPEQADVLVEKIINYETNPQVFRDWRNKIAFVGDDEDNMVHTDQADEIAEKLSRLYPDLNIDKIYIDAFPQESTPGGTRFPAATDAINQSIFKGLLSMTYVGHGGTKGWAQERVLNISDILSWNNQNQLPLLITATCSFAGYDDPAFTSAGEEAILNPRGGALALFTTVRAVFSDYNKELTDKVMEVVFDRSSGRVLTLGEAMKETKNSFTGSFLIINSRKFGLLGDPAAKLGIPEYRVVTEKINGQAVDSSVDTLRALQKVTIEGIVADGNGQILENFNGILYPTVFDKEVSFKTLGQDSRSYPYEFDLQKNILFKGRASVSNGRFSFSFVIPRDINYELGIGKISYYAADENQMVDGAGSFLNIAIGGTDPNALQDNEGPEVGVYMNTEDFAFGGITDQKPTLLVKLNDDNGINVVGNSIGHDLEGVLDNNTQNTYLLNDFYESDLDDFTKGQVRYPLSDLEEGRHEIRVKAWDIANNSSEGYTEFVVASSENIALEHVLNYPNPFTDYTCFQFDHNLANQELDILINIYTVSGRLVKTLEATILSDGAIRRDDCVEWDGKDDYGDQLARGVYLYRVEVRTSNTGTTTLTGESEFEKLVILK